MSPDRHASPNALLPLVIAGALLFSMLAQVSGYSGLIPPDPGERMLIRLYVHSLYI